MSTHRFNHVVQELQYRLKGKRLPDGQPVSIYTNRQRLVVNVSKIGAVQTRDS